MMSCKLCFEDICEEEIVKYRLSPTEEFKDFVYCIDCLEMLTNSIWKNYISLLKKADCEKSLMSVIELGPPINFRDTYIEENKEIYEFSHRNEVKSAKLTGSLSIEERNELHKKLVDIAVKSKNGENVDDFDYIGNITKLLQEYNL